MPAIDFGKQVGPLPLGAWVAIVAGGLGIAWYTRQQGAVIDVPVNDTSGNEGVGTGAGWLAVTPPTDSPAGTNKPTTNEEWAVSAINYLTRSGYDAYAVDIAVRKYLEAQALSMQEKAWIALAIGFLGSPPVPLPPPADGGDLSAPSNLRVSAATRDTISLSWDPVPGAKRYIVALQGVAGFWKNDYDETSVPNYTAINLRPNTDYTFSVYAQDVPMGSPGFISARQSPTTGISGKTAP